MTIVCTIKIVTIYLIGQNRIALGQFADHRLILHDDSNFAALVELEFTQALTAEKRIVMIANIALLLSAGGLALLLGAG